MPLTIIVYFPGLFFQLLWATILLLIAKWQKNEKLIRYSWNLLISIDQSGNAAMAGDPDETVSSRAGKMRDKSLLAKWLSWVLNKIDPNHVEKTREDDEGKDKVLD